MKKSVWYSLTGLIALGFVAVAFLTHSYPSIAAVICPSFYGMEHVDSHIVVDKAMPAPMRRAGRFNGWKRMAERQAC